MQKTVLYNLAVILIATALLAGCASQKKYRAAPVTPQAMNCDGNTQAQVTLYSPADAKLVFDNRSYALNRIETAAGVQYGNSDITFWNKGINAEIIRRNGATTTCTFTPRNGL